MLARSNHIEAIRADYMVDEVMANAPNPENSHIKKHGVEFSSLLEGHFQFGNLGVIHKNHSQEELKLRNYFYEPTDVISMLAAKIKDIEYPGWQELENDMNEEQKH